MSDAIAIGVLDGRRYVQFTADSTADEVNRVFARRYGYGVKPERMFRMFPSREIWAGPEPEKEGEE